MLTGGLRLKRMDSALAELQARMEKTPPAPCSLHPETPGAVDAIVNRCLDPNPDNRFQTTLELQAALEKLDANGKPLPIYRRVSRRALAAAALLVAIMLTGTYYGTRWLSAPVKPPDPVSLIIADLQSRTGDPTFDNTIGQTLRRALEDATFISAYDSSRMSALGVRAPEKLDETAAREIALKQGLGVVLAGSIDRSGGGYVIAVKAMQTV